MAKRIGVVTLLGVMGALVAAWGIHGCRSKDNARIRVSGNIEVIQVEMAFKISGRLAERLVDEGQSAAAGQTLARLDATDQKLRVSQAESELAFARAVLSELEAGSRPEELAQARSRLVQAQAAAQAAESRRNLAQKDLQRYRELLSDKVITPRDFDEINSRYETALNTHREAIAQIATARAARDLAERGPRQESIDQARARAKAAEEHLALARQQLTDAVLVAPFAGVILSKSAEPGAYLLPGSPVVSLGQMDRVWLRAFINAVDVGRIQLNQKAEVSTDSFPGKRYPGRISFISSEAEFTPKTVQTFEERVGLMYRIKIELDNASRELKPGMAADAEIQLQP